MQTAVKTTMNFSPAFHVRLKRIADQENKPMGELIEEKLGPVLETQEREKLNRMYNGLMSLAGMCKDPIRDASTTIDDVLYGAVHQKEESE